MRDINNRIDQAVEIKKEHGVLQGSRIFKKGRVGKRIILFYSRKNDALMPCESDLEAGHCLLLEFDETVRTYLLQPFQLEIHNFKYTPDALLFHYDNSVSLREVKPAGKLALIEVEMQLASVAIACSYQSLPFSIFTEQEIHDEPGYFNRKFIYRALKIKKPMHHVQLAKQKLIQVPFTHLDGVRAYLSTLDLHPLVPEYLMFTGFLKFDTTKKINGETKLWL